MITGVEKSKSNFEKQGGQSVVEFLLLLPMLLAIPFLLIKVNSAVQTSIVNQQYSRSQTLFLAYNSPIYPELRFRVGSGKLESSGMSQITLGVSDNLATGQDDYTPRATEQNVQRTKSEDVGNNDNRFEGARLRGNVRVRGTVSLCTQTNSVATGTGFTPINQIRQGANLQICRGPF